MSTEDVADEITRLQAKQTEYQQRYEQLVEQWQRQDETIKNLLTALSGLYSWVHELPAKDPQQAEWRHEARRLLGMHE
jgi:chromosome segregation ATPase